MLQVFINGAVQGLSFALLSVGFALVSATSRVFYLALGGLYVLSPYVLSSLLGTGQHWQFAVVATILIIAALSMLCEEWIHWPLARKHSPPEVHFISSLGAFLVIVQSAVLMWGSDPRFLREGVESVHFSQGLRLAKGQIVGVIVAAICLGVVFMWLRFSNMGLASRALASNADLLSILGRNVRAVRRTVFAASGALAGIVSLTSALDVGYDPQTGMRAVLVGVAAAIIGGRASFAWAAFAGFTIGVLRATVAWFFSSRWEDPATMLAMAFTLFVFPGGLRSILGPRERLEEEG